MMADLQNREKEKKKLKCSRAFVFTSGWFMIFYETLCSRTSERDILFKNLYYAFLRSFFFLCLLNLISSFFTFHLCRFSFSFCVCSVRDLFEFWVETMKKKNFSSLLFTFFSPFHAPSSLRFSERRMTVTVCVQALIQELRGLVKVEFFP